MYPFLLVNLANKRKSLASLYVTLNASKYTLHQPITFCNENVYIVTEPAMRFLKLPRRALLNELGKSFLPRKADCLRSSWYALQT
jgi:hypothetical protein